MFRRVTIVLLAACGVVGCNSPQATQGARPCRAEAIADPAGEATVRVFAVGLKQDLSRMTSYAAYTALVEEAIAAEAPCFSKSVPNLVVLPENSALMAAFIGSRGAAAREKTDSMAAFAELFQTYDEPLRYYRETFPGTPPIRVLLLALTDTLGRAMEQTFPILAAKHGVYLAVSADLADYVSSEAAAVIARVGDPDLNGQTRAYVAERPEVFNFSIVYGPDGSEIGRVRKAYLVPDEESLLEINYGALEQLRPIETPFGKLAPVISKDAWMPDVLERFNELGAIITLQHEAFSGWGIEQRDGDWLPDVVKESFWNHVQAYDSFRYGVMPCMTGNLLDMVFDCQSAIVKEAEETDAPLSFVGQAADVGFLDVGAWVMADPGLSDATLSLEERRARLRERGEALKPGAGAPYENDYVLSVARGSLSLEVNAVGVPSRRPASAASSAAGIAGRAIVLGGDGVSENAFRPDIAFDGTAHHVVWMREGEGDRYVEYAKIVLGKSTPPARLPFLSKRPYGARITATSTGLLYAVAVADLPERTSSRLLMVKSADGGVNWDTVAVTFDGAGKWARWNPAVGAAGDSVYVVWTDRRAGSSDIYLAASHDRALSFTVTRLDEPAAESSVAKNPANTRNNQALAALAVYGDTIAVTWADFRDYNWDVYGTSSTDAGATWTANLRLNPPTRVTGGEETERIFGLSSVAVGDGVFAVAAEGVDDRGPYRSVRGFAPEKFCGTTCAPPLTTLTPGFRPHVVAAGGRAAMVWHGLNQGDNDLWIAVSATDGWSEPLRVKAPGQQFNARASTAGIVWEDWRSGQAQIMMLDFTQAAGGCEPGLVGALACAK